MKALPVLFQHVRNQFRRMLQVRIHKNQKVSSGIVQTCRHGSFMSKISGKMNDTNPIRMLCRNLVQYKRTFIYRAVIHKKKLQIIFSADSFINRRASLEKFLQACFLIVYRNDKTTFFQFFFSMFRYIY